MYFCPKCNNIYSITNNIDNFLGKQKGGISVTHYTKLIEQIIAKQTIKLPENFSLEKFTDSSEYRKLSTKQKEYVYNKISDELPKGKDTASSGSTPTPMFFICHTCGNKESISSTKLIYNNVGSNISQNWVPTNLYHMKYSNILPRTRRYACPNEKCTSHTNAQTKEAVFFRLNNSHKIKYICLACDSMF